MIFMGSMRLRQRKNGYWFVALPGNKRRSLGTKDKEVAQRLYRRIQREVALGNVVALERDKAVSLKEFKKEYLAWSKTHKKPDTVIRDEFSLRILIDHIGNISLTAITRKMLDDFHAALINKGRKPTGINIEIRHLKSAFSKAVDWGYLQSSPYGRIKPLKSPKTNPRFLTREEIKTIFENITDREFADMITVYLLTGMRRGELVYLNKKDVDLKRGIINVPDQGKTGWRAVPMTDEVQKIMETRARGIGRVFPKWLPNSVTHKWIRLMEKIGLKGVRLHDLRHTCASHLAMAGQDLRTIGEILGHTDPATTMIYAHLSHDHTRKALKKLSGIARIATGQYPKPVK